jgi:hypothetical protein
MAANGELYESERSGFCKPHRDGIHAIAQTGRARAIIENVAKVRLAATGRSGGALHTETVVADLYDVFFGDRFPKTRPACAGFEFRRRTKKRCVAANAPKHALVMNVK